MQTQRSELWTRVEGEDRVGRLERVALTYALPCVKERASEKLLYRRELSPGLRDDLEGGMGVGVGDGWEGVSRGRGYMYRYG